MSFIESVGVSGVAPFWSPSAAVSTGTPVKKRVTTGAVAGGTTANVVITWDEPFEDTNYTVVAAVEDSANDLRFDDIVSRTTTTTTVRIRNTDALNAATGTIHAIAIAD